MAFSVKQPAKTSYAYPFFLTRFAQYISLKIQLRIWLIMGWIITHPKFLRCIFSILRIVQPVLIFRKTVVLSRHEDIVDVFSRNQDFSLAEFSRKGMVCGSFLLNVDWPIQHDREQAAIQQAIKNTDVDLIRDIACRTCEAVLPGNLNGAQKEIDIVKDLAMPVSLAIVTEYFGVPTPAEQEDDFQRWLSDLAAAIIHFPPEGSEKLGQTEEAAAQLTKHITQTMATKNIRQDTVLSRLIVLSQSASPPNAGNWMDEDWVRRAISGLVIFAFATVVRTAADAFFEILTRPIVMEKVRTVSIESRQKRLLKLVEKQDKQDEQNRLDTLGKIIRESLRFRPMLPVLARYSLRQTVIAKGEKRHRRIPAGATVFAAPIAAMFDARAFANPAEFSCHRVSNLYLVFGEGQHACIGQRVAETQLTEMILAVFAQYKVAFSDASSPHVEYCGPAAKGLKVTLV